MGPWGASKQQSLLALSLDEIKVLLASNKLKVRGAGLTVRQYSCGVTAGIKCDGHECELY